MLLKNVFTGIEWTAVIDYNLYAFIFSCFLEDGREMDFIIV